MRGASIAIRADSDCSRVFLWWTESPRTKVWLALMPESTCKQIAWIKIIASPANVNIAELRWLYVRVKVFCVDVFYAWDVTNTQCELCTIEQSHTHTEKVLQTRRNEHIRFNLSILYGCSGSIVRSSKLLFGNKFAERKVENIVWWTTCSHWIQRRRTVTHHSLPITRFRVNSNSTSKCFDGVNETNSIRTF